MRSLAWFGAALALVVTVTSSRAQLTPAGDEVIFIEPLNRQILFGIANAFYSAPTVMRPQNICGNPRPSDPPTMLIPCYEFAMTYISFAPNGDTIVHLPECNGAGPLAANCESSNLCTTITGIPVAPICGKIRADAELLTSELPGTLVGASWSGLLSDRTLIGQSYMNARVGGVNKGRTFRIAVIRIPGSSIASPALGFVKGTHFLNLEETLSDSGYFSPMHRLFTYDPLVGDATNQDKTPVIFQK